MCETKELRNQIGILHRRLQECRDKCSQLRGIIESQRIEQEKQRAVIIKLLRATDNRGEQS